MAECDEKLGGMDERSQDPSERSSVSAREQGHDSDVESARPNGSTDEKPRHSTDNGPAKTITAGGTSEERATRSRSRASSSRSRALSVVPRNKRRGLFGRFAMLPEVNRPYDYSNRMKWLITLIVALAAAGAPMGAGIFLRTFSAASASNDLWLSAC